MPDALETARGLQNSVRALLERIEGGELTTSAATRYRLEGAVVALSVVLGEGSMEELGIESL